VTDGRTDRRTDGRWHIRANSIYAAARKNRLSQSMHVHLKNNHAKFHPNRIQNERALGFFKESQSESPQQK